MSVKNIKNFLRLLGVSNDPIGAKDGTIQYSDGTHRAKGYWEKTDGVWRPMGEVTSTPSPGEIPLNNPSFDGGIAGWTVEDVSVVNASYTVGHETASPISGNGSFSFSPTFIGPPVFDPPDFSAQITRIVINLKQAFTLENKRRGEDTINVSVDSFIESITNTGLVSYLGIYDILVEDLDQSVLLNRRGDNFFERTYSTSNPNVDEFVNDVATFDIYDSSSVNYELKIQLRHLEIHSFS